MRRRYALPAALAGFALILTGCSGGGDELTYEDSPLSQYWGASPDSELSQEEQERKAEEQDKKVEEIVAACMTEQGFEYTPETNQGRSFSSDEAGIEMDPESKEWVAQWGYGAVNNPFQDYIDEQMANEEEPEPSPNQTYAESLSESEMKAYNEALWGPEISEEELGDDGSYEYTWEDGGCYGAAQHEVYGESVYESGEFDDLIEKMNNVYSDAQNDPAMKKLDQEWSSCMADAGHPGFETQPSAQESIYEAQNKLWEKAYEDNPEGNVDLSDSPEMKEIAEKEIVLALADLECREKTNYREETLKIQFSVEEQFVQENKAELEKFKAASEQG